MLAAREETACSNKFVILRSLAMGGMAEILLARVRDPAKPERLMVLKRMHRQLAVDREYVKMFVDEARLAITLRHPNVVEVYESGEDDGQYYIAMEYLHGHDLRRVLSQMAKKRVPMRLANALSIARAVCRGLDYTHERTDVASGDLLGIVHRDVSPHNVLVTYGGRVKLVDFGIAKTTIQLARTRTGILKGKVAYMSPEQALGESLDRRSDVFCIGILLWEMTTGHWLYRRKSELETLKAVVEHDAPPPSQVIAGYPKELEAIVMKTLARKREDRWQTAGELGEALTAFAKQRRLDLRPAALSSLMSATFSEEVESWNTARANGLSLGDHLSDAEHREAVPMLNNDRYSPNPAAIEDLPTTVVWPQQPQQPQASASWRQWLRLRWPPTWLQNPPTWLQIRWYWVVIAAIIALGAAGLLASELLHEDTGTMRAPKTGSSSQPGSVPAPVTTEATPPSRPPPLPSNARDPSTDPSATPGSAAGSAAATGGAAPGATPPARPGAPGR
jgi:serine/threonine protein kinase